jgi:metal-responsive CopG/Arc/MetJ family transcriptional regulator
MKTTVFIPDHLFDAVERLVRLTGRGRNEVYAEALREYLARHSQDAVALAEIPGSSEDAGFLEAAARETLAKTEW